MDAGLQAAIAMMIEKEIERQLDTAIENRVALAFERHARGQRGAATRTDLDTKQVRLMLAPFGYAVSRPYDPAGRRGHGKWKAMHKTRGAIITDTGRELVALVKREVEHHSNRLPDII